MPSRRAVLTAEVVNHFLPKLVELHNYSPANASQQKMYNWNTLNREDGRQRPACAACRAPRLPRAVCLAEPAWRVLGMQSAHSSGSTSRSRKLM